MGYNKEAILQDINMVDVINRLHIPISSNISGTERNGNKRNILCPFHNDQHFGSASIYIDNNKHFKGIHCFACGQSWNAITLVQKCASLNYWDALEWLAECCGDKEKYYIKDKKSSGWGIVSINNNGKAITNTPNNTHIIKDKNPLQGIITTDDMNLLDLHDYTDVHCECGSIIGMIDRKPTKEDEVYGCIYEKGYSLNKDGESLDTVWYLKENKTYKINDFIQDDPDGAAQFLLMRCLLNIKDKESELNKLSGSNNKIVINACHLLKKEIKLLKSIYNKIMNAWCNNNNNNKIIYI